VRRALAAVLAAGCNAEPSTSSTTTSDIPATFVPSLEVPRVRRGDITIDGSLDEAAWARAATTGKLVNPTTGLDDARIRVQGKALLLWNDSDLYAAFQVQDAHVRGGFPADAVDPHLWERDTVELMIDPDGDGDERDYYEVQVSPQNLVFDSRFDGYNSPRGGPAGPFGREDWSSRVASAVRIHGTIDDPSDEDRGYTVELRIPWSAFDKAKTVPPKAGDRWRMNFYAMQDNGGVAWSPILGKGNFHRGSRFGRVTWADR
jgi:hypothetical protein